VGGALDLLEESGVAAEFRDIFRHASDLELSVRVIAAILLARLLEGSLGDFLSDDAQVALASLQERAREATGALNELGHHGIGLARLMQEPLARELLQHPADERALARLAGIPGLLAHLGL
jgi:hypothetical protein